MLTKMSLITNNINKVKENSSPKQTYLLVRFVSASDITEKSAKFVHSRQKSFPYLKIKLSLIYLVILGIGRIETSHLFRHNDVFQYLTDLPTYPNPTTLRRFMLRIVPLRSSNFLALSGHFHAGFRINQ